MITRRLKYLTLLIFCALCSCNSWLTIEPQYEITDKNLYKNTEGYYKAINGVYYLISGNSLYGREMSWGALEAWARGYTITRDKFSTYTDLKELNYEVKAVKEIGSEIWTTAYKAIAQANDIIQHTVDREPTFFTYGQTEKDMIMGESYALRAMLHFDLLRIFATSPKIDAEQYSIPYIDVYPSKFNPPMKSSDVLKRIIADLETALELVAGFDLAPENIKNLQSLKDDIRFSTTTTKHKFHSARGIRLNYYAITALLARANLYAQNPEQAAKYANQLISVVTAKEMTFIAKTDIINNPRMFRDLLFGFYNEKLGENYASYSTDGATNLLVVDDAIKLYPKLGGTAGGDRRCDFIATVQTKYVNKKYITTTGDIKSSVIPNIRLSEMYYIAAECIYKTDMTQAANLLNVVATARGASKYSTSMSEETFITTLTNEYRKDLLGEGQLLFYYKRTNLPIISSDAPDGFIHNGKLSLIIPDSESGI